MFNIRLIISLSIFLVMCSSKEELDKYTVEYKEPYYAVSTTADKLIFAKPSNSSKIVYKLELNRIVRLSASVSLKTPSDLWYLIYESNVKGYTKASDFRIFETLSKAENFVQSSYPKEEKIKASLPLYRLAYNDFKSNDIQNAVIKLFRFLYMNKDLKQNNSPMYYTTMILIGKLYIKQKEYQRALVHFNGLNVSSKRKHVILITTKEFNPDKLEFPIKDIESYFRRGKSYMKKTASLSYFEIPLYMAYIEEKKRNLKKAIKVYNSLIHKRNITDIEITYINFIIDRLTAILPSRQLNLLKDKLNYKETHRYILFKLALMLQEEKGLSYAKDYYKLFIDVFERQYYKNPYPNEIKHYLSAKEAVK